MAWISSGAQKQCASIHRSQSARTSVRKSAAGYAHPVLHGERGAVVVVPVARTLLYRGDTVQVRKPCDQWRRQRVHRVAGDGVQHHRKADLCADAGVMREDLIVGDPIMSALAGRLQESYFAAVLDGGWVIYVARAASATSKTCG